MRRKLLLVTVVVLALAGLGASISWAVTRDGGPGWGRGYGTGYAMMGDNPSGWYQQGSAPVSDMAGARVQAQRFADGFGLKTGEVMQFANNFYVLLEQQNGTPATEVLVDPRSGDVTLEYGPAMMWNTRYGMMRGYSGYGGMMGGGRGGYPGGMMGGYSGDYRGGMMGSAGGSPNWAPSQGTVSGPVSVGRAQKLADEWLAAQGSGLTAGEPDTLPGYYTFHTLKDGTITGMLSVNEQTGAVWYHWWHGRFIAMEE